MTGWGQPVPRNGGHHRPHLLPSVRHLNTFDNRQFDIWIQTLYIVLLRKIVRIHILYEKNIVLDTIYAITPERPCDFTRIVLSKLSTIKWLLTNLIHFFNQQCDNWWPVPYLLTDLWKRLPSVYLYINVCSGEVFPIVSCLYLRFYTLNKFYILFSSQMLLLWNSFSWPVPYNIVFHRRSCYSFSLSLSLYIYIRELGL